MKSTSVVKAFGLLEIAARASGEKSLSELASEARLSKPTAHRILKTLTLLGYVEKTAVGLYRQTSQIRRLFKDTNDSALSGLAEPILKRLHETSGETINLGVIRNSRIVYLRVIESLKPLRRVVQTNSVDPLHCTALGRAILSRLPLDRREHLLRTVALEKRTPYTVTDFAQLMRIIDRAIKNGYAIERDETDLGVTCIAAPLLKEEFVVGAVSLSVPSARLDRNNEAIFVKAICTSVNKLTRLLAKHRNRDS